MNTRLIKFGKSNAKRSPRLNAKLSSVLTLMTILSSSAMAEVVDIKVTNLTQGIYFTPLLVTAHPDSADLFNVGEAASADIQAMAEGGDLTGLVSLADSVGAVSIENPAAGLLVPGATSMIIDMNTGSNDRLSIVAMLLPTNDGFVGLDSWKIPSNPGTYTLYLNAYDAGTEANDEIVNGGGTPGTPGIPANPGGNGGANASGVALSEANQMIHVHRGSVGDTDLTGGISDLDSRIHRWLNPVAKVTVTVK